MLLLRCAFWTLTMPVVWWCPTQQRKPPSPSWEWTVFAPIVPVSLAPCRARRSVGNEWIGWRTTGASVGLWTNCSHADKGSQRTLHFVFPYVPRCEEGGVGPNQGPLGQRMWFPWWSIMAFVCRGGQGVLGLGFVLCRLCSLGLSSAWRG